MNGNTIDLKDVGNAIGTYIDEVVKVWRASRKKMVKELSGKSGRERSLLIEKHLVELEEEWQRIADPLYTFAGSIGVKKSKAMTKEQPDNNLVDAEIQSFRDEQYAYLKSKLLSDLRIKLKSIEARSNNSRNFLIRSQEDDEAIEKAYNSEEYRIAMYAGALLALAYLLCNWVLEAFGRNPMTLWIGVGDKNSCSICDALDGSEMLLSQRSIVPAEGTECMTRCRCILAYT